MPYSGDPTCNTSDAVRLHVGDTDPNKPLAGDEVVAYLLTQSDDNVLQAAARYAEHMAAIYARDAKLEVVGDVRRGLVGRADAMRKLAADLLARSASTFSDEAWGADPAGEENGYSKPYFWRGQRANPAGFPAA